MRKFRIHEIVEMTGGRLLPTAGDVNQNIKSIAIDSRKVEKDALFVTIVGAKSDAHQFLDDVFLAGAAAALVSKEDLSIAKKYPCIYVEDTVAALQKLAIAYRKDVSLPIIGITGSVGKTTTREMVATALRAGKHVFQTKANLNSQIGVPMMMLDIAKEEIAVIEMGISMPGEMRRLREIVKPNVAIVTNIAAVHIENFASLEMIRDEKFRIMDGMQEDSFVLLNAEDTILRDSSKQAKGKVLYFGGSKSDAFASEITLVDGCPHFTAHVLGEEVAVKLKVYGKHQILNALAALLTAKLHQVDLAAAAKALEGFHGFAHRQQIKKKDGYVVIDDTYNASVNSMKAAIDILKDMNVSHRVAILSDMKELGKEEVTYHREVGAYLAKAENIKELWYFGELAKEIADAFVTDGKDVFVRAFENHAQLKDYVLAHRIPDTAYLLKASNSMRLMDIADAMME